jgi:aminodeoxyfutalosine deaminase
LSEGLFTTLNSDDPPMFGTTLMGEYRAAATLGLTAADLACLAGNAVAASFLDDPAKRRILAEIDGVAAGTVPAE